MTGVKDTAVVDLLRACAKQKDLYTGIRLHADLSRRGLVGKSSHVANALISMYAKCGSLRQANESLAGLPKRDVFCWNALIAGYAQHGHAHNVFECFEQMQSEGLSPDAVTLTCILKACASIGAADKGEQIHKQIARQGLLERDMVLGNALVDMYAKCGALAKAQRVLEQLPVRDVVAWSSLIAGYAQQCYGKEALSCFKHMKSEGLLPNAVTFNCVLKACASIKATAKGEEIHDHIVELGLLEKNTLLGNALVDMYAKCGSLAKARQVLEELPTRDVISWSTIIAGYTEWGQGDNALQCFEQMQREGVIPNTVTFACALKACASVGAANKGEHIHRDLKKQELLENDIVLATALVDMYSKCGALGKAQEVMADIPIGDVVLWSAMVAGYTQEGECQQALDCFELMKCKGVSPDAVTFSCVLNACSHAGLVEVGEIYFSEMSIKYGITPEIEHFTCMVAMFGHAGLFDKAASLIQKFPSLNCFAVWSALLGACRKWGEVNIGKWAFKNAMHLDKCVASNYFCMDNTYAAACIQKKADMFEMISVQNAARSQDVVGGLIAFGDPP